MVLQKEKSTLQRCLLGNYEKAKEHYQEAISVDAVCTEAMYNLGKVSLGPVGWSLQN